MQVNHNRLNVSLTPEQEAGIITALETLETALPFVISLTAQERQRLFRMGTRSEGFAREALTAAMQFPDHIPPSIGIVEMEKDIVLRDTLQPVLQRIRTLHTKLNDTWLLAGADAMQIATAVYRVLKATRGVGLDDTINVLGQRFERSSTPTTEEPPTEPVVG